MKFYMRFGGKGRYRYWIILHRYRNRVSCMTVLMPTDWMFDGTVHNADRLDVTRYGTYADRLDALVLDLN